MSICKTCKYWVASDDKYYPPQVRACQYVEPIWHHADVNYSAEAGNTLVMRETSKLAFAQDGEELLANLVTKADFGCNCWEVLP